MLPQNVQGIFKYVRIEPAFVYHLLQSFLIFQVDVAEIVVKDTITQGKDMGTRAESVFLPYLLKQEGRFDLGPIVFCDVKKE